MVLTDARWARQADDDPMLNPGMTQAIAADRQAALRSAAVREHLLAHAETPAPQVTQAARAPRRVVRVLRRLLPA